MMENYDPLAGIAQIKEWVDESLVSLKAASLDEAKARYRTVIQVIDQLHKLDIPIPDALKAEKEDLEEFLNVPKEHERKLTSLAQELSSLAQDINRQLEDKRRRRPTRLEVMFPDGTVICEDKAIDTFVKSLQYIGLKRIAELQSIKQYGHPLVSTQKSESARQVHDIEGYFISTESSTKQKARYLQRIADALRIDIAVDIIDK